MSHPLDDKLTLGSGIILRDAAHELRKVSFQIAGDFAEGQYDDPPLAYVAMVQDAILERIYDAVEGCTVESLQGFARDRQLSAAVDREQTRVLP